MKTRTLPYVGIGLLVVVVGAFSYLQWGDEAPAPATGSQDAAGANPAPLSLASPGSGRGSESPGASLASAESPRAGALSPRSGGFGTPAASTQESRPLTDVEKEKVAAAMSAYQGKLRQIARGNGNGIAWLSEGTIAASLADSSNTAVLGEAIVALGGKTGTPQKPAAASGAPDHKGQVKQFVAREAVTATVTGDVLLSTAITDINTNNRTFVLSQPGSDKTEAEKIAAASQGLSEVLGQFEPGSPAWKEARRQGEELMAKMNSMKKAQVLVTRLAEGGESVKVFDSRTGQAATTITSDTLEITLPKVANPPTPKK
jgi:hypothetical protein